MTTKRAEEKTEGTNPSVTEIEMNIPGCDIKKAVITLPASEFWDVVAPVRKPKATGGHIVYGVCHEGHSADGTVSSIEQNVSDPQSGLLLYSIDGRIADCFWSTEMGRRHWKELQESIANAKAVAAELTLAMALAAHKPSSAWLKPSYNEHFDRISLAMEGSNSKAALISISPSMALVSTPEAVLAQGFYEGPLVHGEKPFDMPHGQTFQPFVKQIEIGEREDYFAANFAKWKSQADIYNIIDNLACFDKDGKLIIPPRDTLLPPAFGKPSWWTGTAEEYANFPLDGTGTKAAVLRGGVTFDREALKDAFRGGKWPVQFIALRPRQLAESHSAFLIEPGKAISRVFEEMPEASSVKNVANDHLWEISHSYEANAVIDTSAGILVKEDNVLVKKIPFLHDDRPVVIVAVPGPADYELSRVPLNLNVRGVVEGDMLETIRLNEAAPHANSYPGYRYYTAVSKVLESCGRKKHTHDEWRCYDILTGVNCRSTSEHQE